jgi:hypothetical protein
VQDGDTPAPTGLFMPHNAAEAIRDAFTSYVGGPREDYRARYEATREALEHERRRVDFQLGLVEL